MNEESKTEPDQAIVDPFKGLSEGQKKKLKAKMKKEKEAAAAAAEMDEVLKDVVVPEKQEEEKVEDAPDMSGLSAA
jgi:hypothetical protein